MPPLDLAMYPHLLLRLMLAFVAGGAIGFEREIRGHPAGLRTHILVCLGAALISAVDSLLPSSGGRIAAQVVTGVGFLGAGTILRSDRGMPVHGLTTAASLWCVAGIGIAFGYGGTSVWLALTATVMILVTLTLVAVLEEVATRRRRDRTLVVYLRSPDEKAASTVSSTVLDAISKQGVKIRSVHTEQPDESPLMKVMHLQLRMPETCTPDYIANILCDNPQVSQFDWEP